MKYFRVTAKHGHHGYGRYQPITFAFCADNAISAMDMAKAMPGVKHDQSILSCCEIPFSEYVEYRKKSAYQRMEEV